MKRTLIITYYWPPAGGPGVQRWLKFVTYFKEFGIEPVVYIPENPHYPLIDEAIVSEVPLGIEILRYPVKEPYKFAGVFSKKKTKQISSGIISSKQLSLLERTMLWVRGNFFIPDARIGWVAPSIQFLEDYIDKNPIDVVITSGPPHSLHLIGLGLKEKLNINWISDFRDPWTTIHYHQSLRLSKASQVKHKKLEANVLKSSDRVVVTSNTTKKEFSAITDRPIHVITNGFERKEGIQRNLDSKFTFSHIGSLLSERNPSILWQVLSELCQENDGFASNFQLKLFGAVSQDIIDTINSFRIGDKVMFGGYISHSEAIQEQYNSQVLLLIEMDKKETAAIIPGKLFEYLAAERPILALGPKDSDVESILKETKAGNYFCYDDAKDLKKSIEGLYSQYKNGVLEVNSTGIEKYSRRELTASFSTLIKGL